jgi:hypothetical protein
MDAIEAKEPCRRSGCRHARRYHNQDGCRTTGCSCRAFVAGKEEAMPGRRVCIDVPDGYVLSMSLIPHEPLPPEPLPETPAEPAETPS